MSQLFLKIMIKTANIPLPILHSKYDRPTSVPSSSTNKNRPRTDSMVVDSPVMMSPEATIRYHRGLCLSEEVETLQGTKYSKLESRVRSSSQVEDITAVMASKRSSKRYKILKKR